MESGNYFHTAYNNYYGSILCYAPLISCYFVAIAICQNCRLFLGFRSQVYQRNLPVLLKVRNLSASVQRAVTVFTERIFN